MGLTRIARPERGSNLRCRHRRAVKPSRPGWPRRPGSEPEVHSARDEYSGGQLPELRSMLGANCRHRHDSRSEPRNCRRGCCRRIDIWSGEERDSGGCPGIRLFGESAVCIGDHYRAELDSDGSEQGNLSPRGELQLDLPICAFSHRSGRFAGDELWNDGCRGCWELQRRCDLVFASGLDAGDHRGWVAAGS